jgi:hypothetical protein
MAAFVLGAWGHAMLRRAQNAKDVVARGRPEGERMLPGHARDALRLFRDRGDAGVLAFWITPRDLADRRFDHAVATLDGH